MLYLFLFFLSLVFTGLIRRYALLNSVLDIPNQRSAHSIPMPRGGGLAFVLCFLGMLLGLVLNQKIDTYQFLAFFSASTLVASLGFLDDKFHLSAKIRLLGHFISAAILVYYLESTNLWVAMDGSSLLVLVKLFCLIYLVWYINLYNFMDGIDGLGALQTIFVCLAGSVLFALAGQLALMKLPLLLASSVAGFLVWNFPPARIFMGDVGSGFLGLLLGIFSLFAWFVSPALFFAWFILNGVFLCDTSITLLRRIWGRENIFEAHCSHSYQQAARYYKSHKAVTLAVLGINVAWLFPIAIMVQQKVLSAWLGVVIAFVPLSICVIKFNAKK